MLLLRAAASPTSRPSEGCRRSNPRTLQKSKARTDKRIARGGPPPKAGAALTLHAASHRGARRPSSVVRRASAALVSLSFRGYVREVILLHPGRP